MANVTTADAQDIGSTSVATRKRVSHAVAERNQLEVAKLQEGQVVAAAVIHKGHKLVVDTAG